MSAYKFRQRSGKVDWQALGEVDIDDVIGNGRLGDLQSVLDNVTFSEITLGDIRQQQQEPGNVLKLVKSMQLMLEYVLQGQEFQAGLVQKMHSKYGPLKKKVSRLETENVFLKEDIKVYKRQLAGLRSRLQAEGKDTDLPADYGLEVQESPVRNPLPPGTPAPEQKQGDDNDPTDGNGDVKGLVLDLISRHKGLLESNSEGAVLAKIETMQSSLLSAIETLQQQARAGGGAPNKESPLRKRAKSGHSSPHGVEGEGDRSFNLSMSSSSTGAAGGAGGVPGMSPLAYDIGQEEEEVERKPPSQMMTVTMLATAEDMQRDLQRQLEQEHAKKESELAQREKEVAEKMSRIHLIEKSVLQSQVVMERERLALAEERFALTPLRALKKEISDRESVSSKLEEERKEMEVRKAAEMKIKEQEDRRKLIERNKVIAAKIVKARLSSFSWKKLLNRFRKWVAETLNKRDREAFQRQQEALRKVAQLEVASKEAASESREKEQELKEQQKQIIQSKEKQLHEQLT